MTNQELFHMAVIELFKEGGSSYGKALRTSGPCAIESVSAQAGGSADQDFFTDLRQKHGEWWAGKRFMADLLDYLHDLADAYQLDKDILKVLRGDALDLACLKEWCAKQETVK